ncbi:glycoside hydrolase family 25 protein [Corynebacterium sp. L4756]|uniref:glycoside hydrolase family 25 protein n=1 Tax=unclassified Corynebacterium TaxID=2624378 RepID=UPI00374CC992
MRKFRLLTAVTATAAVAGSLLILPATAIPGLPANLPSGLLPDDMVQTASTVPGIASGVDVSRWQHPDGQAIAWDQVKTDGQSFAVVKASEGTTWTNEHLVQDTTDAAANGLKVGTYHYARPAGDAREQARHYASHYNQVANHSLPPVLDLEVSEGKSPEQLAQWTRDFMDEIEIQTGRTPMMYTYRYFWIEQMGNTQEFANYPLWLAAYQSTAPEPVGGWQKMDMWQRSDSGRVNGIAGDVDLNLFNGNQAQLDMFASGQLQASGGKLEGLTVDDGIDLGGDATVVIGVILALAAGLIAAPALADAAQQANLDGLPDVVNNLIATNSLPTDQLQTMQDGNYTLGDLVILLDNANHVAEATGTNNTAEYQAVMGALNGVAGR